MAIWHVSIPTDCVYVYLCKYCPGESAIIHEKGDHIIFEFTSATEDYEWEEGEGWLSSLISLRADIFQGDYRALYLAWLFCVQMEEMEDDELEPPVPPNLADLNAPLKSFVDFMRINTDLIAIAAANSISESRQTDPEALKTWIRNLSASEKDDILFRLVEAPRPHLGVELIRRFQKTVSTKANSKMGRQLRSVEDLISRTETYAEAVKLLVDLRDLNKKTEKEGSFNGKLSTICQHHHRKVTFLNRLKKAGLIS
jgi:hypothetical protein